MKKSYLWVIPFLFSIPALGQNFAIDTVYFGFDRFKLTKEGQQTLDSLTVKFINYPNYYVEIFGHTDSSGSDEYNLKLSEIRAREVAVYLMNKGVQVERIVYEGIGTAKPAASNRSYSGRSENRRVDIGVLYTNDRAPLPQPKVDTTNIVAVPIVTIDPASLIDTIYCDYGTFTIKSAKSYRLIAPKGSEVLIPLNAFETESEDLSVEFKELFKTSEYLMNQMPLMEKDGPLESPGMLSFTITDGRRPVDVVEGTKFEVKLPTTRRDQNMVVYKGTGGGRGGRRSIDKDADPAEDPGFTAVTRWVEQEGEVVRYDGPAKKYIFNVDEPARFAVARMLYYAMNAERNDKGFDLTVKFKGKRYPKTTFVMLAGENVKTTIPLKKRDDRVYEADKVKFINDKAPIILFAMQYDEDGNPWVINYKFRVADYAKKGKGKGALPTVFMKLKFKQITEDELQDLLVDLDN